MITVTGLANGSSPLLLAYLDMQLANTDYYRYFGNVLITVDPSSYTSQYRKEVVPFGHLSQGKVKYGSLRDKDVYHLNGKGNLVVDELMVSNSIVPPWSTKVSYACNLVNLQGFNGSWGVVPVQGTVLWGNNASFADEYQTSMYDFVHRDWRNPAFLRQFSYVRFAGDVCVHVQYIDAMSFTLQGDPLLRQYNVGATAQCMFHRRVGQSIQSSHAFYASADKLEDLSFDFPSLSCKVADVVPSPDYFGVTFGPVSNYRCYLPTLAYPTDVNAIVDRVVEFLCKGSTRSYVAKNFQLHPAHQDWDQLGADVLSQQNYVDASLLLTGFDLVGLLAGRGDASTLSSLLKRKLKSPKEVNRFLRLWRQSKSLSKALSNFYLGVDYAVLPAQRDITAFFQGVRKLGNQFKEPSRKHARRSSEVAGSLQAPILTEQVLTVEVDQLPDSIGGDAMKVINGMHKWGVYPTLTMLHDLVPFSYILDWFIKIQSMVEHADRDLWLEYFPIHHVIMGQKRIWCPATTEFLPFKGVSGELQFTEYTRNVSFEFPLPPLQLEAGDGPWKHWAEATALVVQRVR